MNTNQRIYVEFMLTRKVSGLRVNTKELVTWASGIKSPIYVDNRMSHSNFGIRNMIYQDIADYIRSNHIPCDAILAAPTGGLHIGASIANILGVPFLLIKNGVVFEVRPLPPLLNVECADVIVASNADAIPVAILQANQLKLPFAYTRETKGHGLDKCIEGYQSEEDGQTWLLDYYFTEPRRNYAMDVIARDSKLRVTNVISHSIQDSFIEFIMSGEHVVILEDLFSTSESAVKQVNAARILGAIVDHTIGVYDYELEESNTRVQGVGVQKHAFITAKNFLDIAQEIDPLIKEQRSVVNQFLADPWHWHEKK